MPAFHFSPFAIPAAVTAAVVIGFAITIVVTRFSRTSVAVFILCVAAAAWQVACVFMYLAVDSSVAMIWARVGCACVPFIAAAAYQFVAAILESANHRRIICVVAWLLAARLIVVTMTTTYLVGGVRRFWWGFYPTYNMGGRVLYPLFCGS